MLIQTAFHTNWKIVNLERSFMEYFVQDRKGKELGPIDQGTLKDWAKKGQVKPNSNVRNTLMKSWKSAKDIVILQDIFKEQAEIESQTLTSRIKENVGSHRDNQSINNLILTKESIKAGSVQFRLGSFIIDATILGAFAYAILFVYLNFVSTGGLLTPESIFQHLVGNAELAEAQAQEANQLLFKFTIGAIIAFQLYWTLTVGLWAQTLGQKFFGLMQIKHNTLGNPVLLGRAYFFSFFFVLFFPINFFFIFVFRRGLHEILSGSSVVNVRLG